MAMKETKRQGRNGRRRQGERERGKKPHSCTVDVSRAIRLTRLCPLDVLLLGEKKERERETKMTRWKQPTLGIHRQDIRSEIERAKKKSRESKKMRLMDRYL